MERKAKNTEHVKNGKVPLGIGQDAAEVDDMHRVYQRYLNGEVIDPRQQQQPRTTTISKMDLGVQTLTTSICKMKDETSPTGSRYFSAPPTYYHVDLVNPATERFLRPQDAHLYDGNINIEDIVHPSALRASRDVALYAMEPLVKIPVTGEMEVERTSFPRDGRGARGVFCDVHDNVIDFSYSREYKDFAAAVVYNTSGHKPVKNAESLSGAAGSPKNIPMAPVEAPFPLHKTIKESIENALKHLLDKLCVYATPAEIWDRATHFESEVNIAP